MFQTTNQFITTDISFVLKQPKKSTTIQRLEGEIRGFIEGVAEFHQPLLSADHGDGTLPGVAVARGFCPWHLVI